MDELRRRNRRLSRSLRRHRRSLFALLKELVKAKRRIKRIHPEVVTAQHVADFKEAASDAIDDTLDVGKSVLKSSKLVSDQLDQH